MDQAKLGRVIGLWESGVSVSALAAEVNISDSTDLEKVASKDFRTTEETMVLLTKQPPEHQAVTIVGPTLGVTASPWIVRAQLKEAGLTRRGNALGVRTRWLRSPCMVILEQYCYL
ncbi:uncharacterized protein LOC125499835 isoform X11 [Athalia rosae]|uniref:uncharacterized protein LOC125499835 isoform X11 n=1 Tax=Athalia rosae TaxID=37344 RepID=UPI002033D2BC|nr:uncharacterized protein LOC125499835 isoform X11 [Athalia rosae]